MHSLMQLRNSCGRTILRVQKVVARSNHVRTNSNVQTSHLVRRPQYLKFNRYQKPKNETENLLLLEENDAIGTFLTKLFDRKESSEQKPNIVPSLEESRLMACHCDAEGLDIRYTMLHKNCSIQCECGHWFKLIDAISPFTAQKGGKLD